MYAGSVSRGLGISAPLMVSNCFPVYYASGCSIAKFPEDGVVITQTFKDQGKEGCCSQASNVLYPLSLPQRFTVHLTLLKCLLQQCLVHPCVHLTAHSCLLVGC